MFDPHSTFMSVDSLEQFNEQINNSFVGIGAQLQSEDGYRIKMLLPEDMPRLVKNLVRMTRLSASLKETTNL